MALRSPYSPKFLSRSAAPFCQIHSAPSKVVKPVVGLSSSAIRSSSCPALAPRIHIRGFESHANMPSLHPGNHQAGDSIEGKHEWKLRAPYRFHEPNEHFNARYEAGCHCGKVKYQLSRDEPLDSKLCHCTTCERALMPIKRQ